MKRRFQKACLFTLFFGGILLMLVPPATFLKGEEKSRETVAELKEAQQDGASGEECMKEEKVENIEREKGEADTDGLLGYLTIRRINAEYPIREGTDSSVLSWYIGHLPETAAPGSFGNCVLAGHRGGRHGLFFKELDQLEYGDPVQITDREGKTHVYLVQSSYVTDAYDQTVKDQEEDQTLTLLTCAENGTKRLVVLCSMEEKNKEEKD